MTMRQPPEFHAHATCVRGVGGQLVDATRPGDIGYVHVRAVTPAMRPTC